MPSQEKESEENQDKKFEQYKMIFEQYTNTRTERTEYNKWYTNLLFIQTLVAVLTAVLAAKTEILSTMLTTGLLVLVFVAGAVIAFTWFLKLIALNSYVCSQKKALIAMEDAKLSPFCAVKTENAAIEAYLGKKGKKASWVFRRRRKALSWNYYLLPRAITVLFVIAAVFVLWWGLGLPV